MKQYFKSLILVSILLTASAVVFSGCSAKSYSKGFDEAD